MKDPDLLRAVNPVVQVFDELAIPYYISGSIASSVYGLARSTIDVLGVIKVQADSLDKGYLQHWSQDLGIFELLERAFAEAGIPLQP